LLPIPGAPPSLINRPTGCPFHPRCRFAEVPGPCDQVVPELLSVRGAHLSACHRTDALEGVTVEELRQQADPDDLLVEDVAVEAP
jgi:ABC-type antimicrobial peptide transport system ATPase subunit